MKYLILLSLSIWTFISCKPKIEKSVSDRQDTIKTITPAIKIQKNFTPGTKITYTVDSVYIKDDLLNINVSYSGGCKEQYFQLITNGNLLEPDTPKIEVYLTHNKNGDACRKLEKKNLRFGIKAIKPPSKSKVILILNKEYSIEYSN